MSPELRTSIILAIATIVGAVIGVCAKAFFDGLSDSKKRRRNELEKFWRPLSDQLCNSRICFDLQNKLRKRLIERLEERELWPKDSASIPVKLEKLYPQMTDVEHNLHAFIREITFGGMFSANDRMVHLLEEYPQYSFRLEAEMIKLREHLMLWLAKAKRDRPKPSVCLVYVGVEEDVRFPPIEEPIRRYISEYRA